MVLDTYKKTCKDLIFGVSGVDISTCEVVQEGGLLYIKLKFGSKAEKAVRLGIKLLEMSCTSQQLKVVLAKVLEAVSTVVTTIMVPLLAHK